MPSPIAKRQQTAVNLLNRILNEPDLPVIVKNLDAELLARLIRHVGLEDSGPIIFHATSEQLKNVLDEDLWHSEAPGQTECFDADRFGLWLEILIENGSAFAAHKVLEMDEDLLILGIRRLVRVVKINALNHQLNGGRQMDHEGFPESFSNESLGQAIAGYGVISKSNSSWDAILGLFAQLNETNHDTLVRLLDRCCSVPVGYVEESTGLLKRLSDDEMLEEDVAGGRENRKEARGFVSPASARFFLDQSRSVPLKCLVSKKAMPHYARLYIRTAETKTASVEQTSAPGHEAAKHDRKGFVSFFEALREADVLPDQEQQKLGYDGEDFGDTHIPMVSAMRVIKESDPDLYAQRVLELSFLSNTLISGCSFRGRAFHPKEAAEAALSVCNLGGEYLLEIGTARNGKSHFFYESVPALLKANHLVGLFQAGWKILFDSVVLTTAKAVLVFVHRLKEEISAPDQKKELARMALVLRAGIFSGRPWKFNEEIDYLLVFIDGESTAALKELIREYPTFTETMCKKEEHRLSSFIWSRAHIRTLRHFLDDVFG